MRHSLSFLFIISAFFLQAQTCLIKGTVSGKNSGLPLEGANVVVKNKNNGTTTNAHGQFSIDGLKCGSYTIKVTYMGYQTLEQKIKTIPEQREPLNFILEDTVITSVPIEIRAQGYSPIAKPGRINIITAEQIALAPVQNIENLFDFSTGINVSNTTGIFSSKSIVSMRGLPANEQSRTLVILDGIPLNKSDEGSVNWNMINKNNIDCIKITKGPGHARYGSGAMGGVIEITSRKPSKKLEGNALLSYGTFNTMSGDISLAGKQQKDSLHQFYWSLNTFARKSDGYITTPEVFRTIEDTILVPTYLKEINSTLKAGYNLGNAGTIEAQISFFDDSRGNGVKVFDNFGAFSKHKTFKEIIKYDGTFGYSKISVTTYNSDETYNRMYEYMNEGEYKLYEANALRSDRGCSGNISYFNFKNHKLETGFEVKYGHVDGTDTYYTSTDIIRNAGKMNTYALYFQDDINLTSQIQLNAGIRYDAASFYDALFSITYPSYSVIFYQNFQTSNPPPKKWDALCPRLSIQYKLPKENRIYISAARGFRAPVLDDLSRTGRRKGSFSIANPNLNPELLTALETGADIKILKYFTFSPSAFYSIGKDFMYFSSTGDSVNMGYKLAPIFTKKNIGKVIIKGAEAEVKFTPGDKFNAFVNYAFTNAIISEHLIKNTAVDSNLTGKFLTDVPTHKFSAGCTFLNKLFNTSLLLKYNGTTWINEWNTEEKEYFRTDKFPAYSLVNIRIEKEFLNRFNVSCNIDNIFNKIYTDASLQQCPGRMIFLNIKIKL